MAHTKVIIKHGRIELSGSYSYLSSSLHEDSGSLVLGTSGSNRMFIKEDGKIGIGTTAPLDTFDFVFDTDSGNRRLRSYGTGGVRLQREGDTSGWAYSYGFLSNDASNDWGGFGAYGNDTDTLHYWYIGKAYNNTAVTILGTGKVGIGTTSPSKLLHVAGDAQIDGTLTAQEFHTEFVSASIVFSSGSTKFGDTMDDVHQFTGSLQLSGSVGNESYIIGTNFGIGTTNPAGALHINTEPISNKGQMVIDEYGLYRYDWNNDGSALQLNRVGYLGGTSKFRDLKIMDGKGSTVMFVDGSSARVGIGTTSPGRMLHIESATGSGALRLESSQTASGKYAFTEFYAYDGTSSTGIGEIGVASSGTNGPYGNNLYLIAYKNAMTFMTGGANERMRIDSSGKVGIGTTSPGAKLDVAGTTASHPGRIFITDDGSYNPIIKTYRWTGTASNYYSTEIKNTAGDMAFSVGASAAIGSETMSEKMRIQYTGNVGIGTTTVPQKLTVAGNISGSGTLNIDGNATFAGVISSGYTGTNGYLNFKRSSDGATAGGVGLSSTNVLDIGVNGGSYPTIRFLTDSSDRKSTRLNSSH
jgi:cytoskeletal protein CcmA (bactofilin family)